jgi:hypothetical protein
MSSVGPLILAAKPQFGSWDDPLLLTSLTLVATLVVGGVVFALVTRLKKKKTKEQPVAGDQLSHFRSLYDQGQLSREEFDRIRAKLGAKLRKEMQVPAKEDATPAPRPPEPPANGTPKP